MATNNGYKTRSAHGFDAAYEQRSREALLELHALMAGPDDFTILKDDPELKNPNDEFHHPAPMIHFQQTAEEETHAAMDRPPVGRQA